LPATASVRAEAPAPAENLAASRDLARRLRDPRCYTHPVAAVEACETHISHVLLAGEFAYKLRKPVRLPFLDFTRLEARRLDCEEEVRLNRRTAPALYLGVSRITGSPLEPRVDGEGPAFEYAVRMRRFAPGAVLGDLADQGRLTREHVDALAAGVAEFHRDAERVAVPQERAAQEAARAALANFHQMAALAADDETRERLRALEAWTLQEKEALAPVFAERAAAGFVRDGHGDLHLGNVALVDSRPLLFDCLEFSPALRCGDVAGDVAFTFMDLARHGLERLAARFVSGYVEASGDYGVLAVLRFYAVYRAVVRAKVALVMRAQAASAAQGTQAAEDCGRCLALAQRLTRRGPALLVLMHGPSGSGKTTASARLVEALGAVRIRSDVERKRLHGIAAREGAAAAPGAGIYGAAGNEATDGRLAELVRSVLTSGYPAIVDATFLSAAARARFADLARRAGAGFQLVSCEAPAPVLRERVTARARTADDASDATVAVLESQLVAADPLDADERRHAVRIDTSAPGWEHAVESFARRILAEAP